MSSRLLIAVVLIGCEVDPVEGIAGGSPSSAGGNPSGAVGTGGSAGGPNGAAGSAANVAGGGLPNGGSGSGGAGEPCAGKPDGFKPPELQAAQDCHESVCESGELTHVPLPGDGPLDAPDDCVVDSCDLINGLPQSTPLPVGTECSDGGMCDAVASCVECLEADDCPDGSDPCAAAICDAGVCGFAQVQGDPTGTCFPYVCDGVAATCPTSCVVDADCNNRTCDGGVCIALGSCDLEWVEFYTANCGSLGTNTNSVVGVDASGRVYLQSMNQLPPVTQWGFQRLSIDDQLTPMYPWFNTTLWEIIPCKARLGPLGGLVQTCYQDGSTFVLGVEYDWNHGIGGGGNTSSGEASIDGANNVFWSATEYAPGGVVVGLEQLVFDLQGNDLPATTPWVPPAPSQLLPGGFDTVWLDQLTGGNYTIDWAGNITVTGTAIGPVDMGGGVLDPTGALDVVVARYDAAAQHLWSRRFEASGASATLVSNQFGATDGSVIIRGQFAAADFGWGSLPQSGNDEYLLKLSSGGEPVCGKTLQGPTSASEVRVDTGPSGEILLSSTYHMVLDGARLGPQSICWSPLVVAKLRP